MVFCLSMGAVELKATHEITAITYAKIASLNSTGQGPRRKTTGLA